MNLRQKVKKAKRDLAELELKHKYEYTDWGIMQSYLAQTKLREVIEHKKKSTRHYRWDETPQIDWDKLTYMEIVADYHTLAILKSPNGKPLDPKIIKEFVHDTMRTKLYNYARNVSKMDRITTHEGQLQMRGYEKLKNTVEYAFIVSSDRTKQKLLHRQVFYFQMRGDDQLYKPKTHVNP